MDPTQAETSTATLHRLTAYVPDREWQVPVVDPLVRQDIAPSDPARQPPSVKSYPADLPRTALPRELPVGRTPALAALRGGGSSTAQLDLAGLSRVLFLSAGVVRTAQRESGTVLYRAAGSAGNRFPLELYVSIPETDTPGSDLPAGVHWYDPLDHALVRIGPAPAGTDSGSVSAPAQTQAPAPAPAPALIVTGVPWRTGWRYGERGYRHIYWDCGTMLSQLLPLADSAGFAPRLFTEFPDAAVSELVGVDAVHEWPIAVVSLGTGTPALKATETAVAGLTAADPVEYPLVTAAQLGGITDRLGEPWDFGTATTTTATAKDQPGSPTLDEVIIKRGSQRRMDPSRGLSLDMLRTSMTVALHGIAIPHWIAVNDVTGLAPGLYRWPDLERPVRTQSREEMRAELYRVCLDQALGRDAAFVVIAATDVATLSDRQYREAQLGAGIVEGRLHLAAYALGASATGMTFLDSEIPALLGAPDAPHGLIFTCVGVPGNTSRPAGLPGAPAEIRPIAPRE